MLGSIEAGGTTFRDFLDGAGHEGGNVENLRVYGRDGEPCTVCGTEIQLTKIAGRGTRYCPKCQKSRRRNAAPKQEIQNRPESQYFGRFSMRSTVSR